jgi:hypothetical protein
LRKYNTKCIDERNLTEGDELKQFREIKEEHAKIKVAMTYIE